MVLNRLIQSTTQWNASRPSGEGGAERCTGGRWPVLKRRRSCRLFRAMAIGCWSQQLIVIGWIHPALTRRYTSSFPSPHWAAAARLAESLVHPLRRSGQKAEAVAKQASAVMVLVLGAAPHHAPTHATQVRRCKARRWGMARSALLWLRLSRRRGEHHAACAARRSWLQLRRGWVPRDKRLLGSGSAPARASAVGASERVTTTHDKSLTTDPRTKEAGWMVLSTGQYILVCLIWQNQTINSLRPCLKANVCILIHMCWSVYTCIQTRPYVDGLARRFAHRSTEYSISYCWERTNKRSGVKRQHHHFKL
jgi:hypothetical protein